MINKTTYILTIIALAIFSCSDEHGALKRDLPPSNEHYTEGFQLLENNCFSCHSPNAALENAIAPTMSAMKENYVMDDVSRAQFTRDLISFLNNPSEENARIPGAVKRFGVMPKMSLSDAEIAKIATYIYYSELDQPGWFEKNYQVEKEKFQAQPDAGLTPLEIGKNMAMKTKGVLGKNLLEAINTQGTENALAFCSTRAIALTDSVATSLNARIRRVSDKNRNPDNSANDAELSYIAATKLAIAQGDSPKPQLTQIGDKQVGYYPILTNEMCMQCHGQEETEILPNTLARIHELYPNDLATGYKVDELRGIWVVEME